MRDLFIRLLGFGKVLWSFFAPLLKKQVADSLEKILPIALSVVSELVVDNGLSGNEKAKIAQERILKEVTKEGISAGTSLINLSIEIALQKLKDNE